MGHDHAGHSHGLGANGTATGRHRKRLALVVAITLTGVVVQLIGAAVSGSLSLLADAGHMLSDAAGVSIALFAAWIATRPATSKRTFGWQRAEVLAALANAVALSVIAIVIFIEAVRRFGDAPDIETPAMLLAAVVGGVANLACLLILHSGRKDSLNLRGAYLEVLGDLLGSAAVVAAGLVILFTGQTIADPIASMVIALMILPRAWSLLREVVDVLLEATPRGVDLDEVRRHILEIDGVVDVHDLHAWTITSGQPVCSAHVTLTADAFTPQRAHEVLDTLLECLGDHFDTEHSTFQLEPEGHARHEPASHD
ncbi:cation diffusion facilitator family transporter [Zafaria sp. Z1313]|uniref:cation diffusion facilitator family transporter n=1 Tax=unclassified Zafaria TaxID=2828765 RepID=UPI002E7AA201|nr:cation diffusion facilitator family transporter [Zafaria sp. J156]MEE1622135.1 cation diffusion facilitator family transporter [Zafaria sp. J156]